MSEQRIPIFDSGNLLTQDMMESLQWYTMASSELTNAGYADGVLCGCKLSTNEQEIIVHKGILWFSEKPFFLTEPVHVAYKPSNTWLVLRAAVGDTEEDHSYQVQLLTIDLVAEDILREQDIELCRFKLQNGAVLRDEYRTFADMETEFDTISRIHAKWAAYRESSLAPEILNSFVRQARKHTLTDALDRQFCQQVLAQNGRAMSREAILFYIEQRLGRSCQTLSNEEIFKALLEILEKIKYGRTENRGNIRRNQRIIVD